MIDNAFNKNLFIFSSYCLVSLKILHKTDKKVLLVCLCIILGEMSMDLPRLLEESQVTTLEEFMEGGTADLQDEVIKTVTHSLSGIQV